jgi:hypothetical protein
MGSEKSGHLKDVALIRLDGQKIMKDGKMEKTELLDFLKTDLSDYSDIAVTPEQYLSLRNHAALPRKCIGKRCKDYTCPFHKAVEEGNAKYPLFRPCFIEAKLFQAKQHQYIEELNVDVESATEMVMVNELCSIDIKEYRINQVFSGGHEEEAVYMLHTEVVANGDQIRDNQVLHPLVDAQDKLARRRQHILDALVATPREKYKKAAALKQSDDNDMASFYAQTKKKYAQEMSANNVSSAKDLDKVIDELADIDPEVIEADWSMKEEE